MLIRPVSPALQTATTIVGIHGAGNLLLGVTAFLVASQRTELDWTASKILWVLLTVTCGLIALGAITFLANMIGFWEPGPQSSFPFMIVNLVEFAKFPLDLYDRGLRFLLTAVVPYGFISYYPSLILLDKETSLRWLGWLTPLAPVVLVLVTARLWKEGLARYQGVGH